MMYLHLLSFNFHNSTPELREALYVPETERVSLLKENMRVCEFDEVFWLSTCHRVECYVVSQLDTEQAYQRLDNWLRQRFSLSEEDQSCLRLSGAAAVRHLLLVATSLDSFLVGEPQILGQVKQAYRQALQAESLGTLLKSLLQHAFYTAKRVRTETKVAVNPLSISQVAVRLARKIFSSLNEKCLLLLGAGEMAQLAALELKKAGLRNLKVASRTITSAQALAEQVQGQPICFSELDAILPTADIVLGSSGAPEPLITQQMASKALKARKGKPIFFIDIAMPHDIQPSVNSLANAYRYELIDLQQMAEENRISRQAEIQKALALVDRESQRWLEKQHELLAVPIVKALRLKVTRWGEAECQRTLTALAYQDPHLAQKLAPHIKEMMHRFIRRLLHLPSIRLKRIAAEQALLSTPQSLKESHILPTVTTQVQVLAELFDLDTKLEPNHSLLTKADDLTESSLPTALSTQKNHKNKP